MTALAAANTNRLAANIANWARAGSGDRVVFALGFAGMFIAASVALFVSTLF